MQSIGVTLFLPPLSYLWYLALVITPFSFDSRGSPFSALVAPTSSPSPLSVLGACSLKLGYDDILPLIVLWMKWFSMIVLWNEIYIKGMISTWDRVTVWKKI